MPIREKVTYPKVTPLPGSDPCKAGCSSSEHVLDCGHSVITATPDNICGINSWAVAWSPANSIAKIAAGPKFWCDACIEEMIEQKIEGKNISAQEAEDERHQLREMFLTIYREPQTQARKTYISEKRVALPVDNQNRPLPGYEPPKPKHPFEIGQLHAGRSFHEDIVPTSTESLTNTHLTKTKTSGRSTKPLVGTAGEIGEHSILARSGTKHKDSPRSWKTWAPRKRATLQAVAEEEDSVDEDIPEPMPESQATRENRARRIMNADGSRSPSQGPAPAVRKPFGW